MGAADALAASLIRGDLYAHLAVGRVAEQAPAATHSSLTLGKTKGSDEPGTARAGRFRSDPAKQDRSLALDMLIACGERVAHRDAVL